jgi:hypothetical protein
MEPKRFQLYKTNSQKQMRYFLVFSIIMIVLGLAGLISELGFNYRIFNLQTNLFVLLALQGAIGVFIARKNFDNIKYFVSWDENELNYHLPNNSEPVNIRLTEIRKIERESQKIRIELKTGEVKYFGFTYFYFPTRTTILDFFEGLKVRVEQDLNLVV